MGFLGHRAQRHPLPQAVPRRYPTHRVQSELCPHLGPVPQAPTFQQGLCEAEQTGLSGCMPARGYELLPRIICHELRVPFHMPKVGCPALALAAWLRGPHSNCARTETLFSPMARGLRPSPSVQHPLSDPPRPHPRARGPLLHGSTQSRLDRVIPKTSFPGFFKPGILLTGKVTVTKMSHPNLAWLFCTRP